MAAARSGPWKLPPREPAARPAAVRLATASPASAPCRTARLRPGELPRQALGPRNLMPGIPSGGASSCPEYQPRHARNILGERLGRYRQFSVSDPGDALSENGPRAIWLAAAGSSRVCHSAWAPSVLAAVLGCMPGFAHDKRGGLPVETKSG